MKAPTEVAWRASWMPRERVLRADPFAMRTGDVRRHCARKNAIGAAALLSGCCLGPIPLNTPEPCHPHAAQSQRYDVSGTCGPDGVIEIVAPAGDMCDATVSGGPAVGLPAEGHLYGAGTAPLIDGGWFLGPYGRDFWLRDTYVQCYTLASHPTALTAVGDSPFELVCQEIRGGGGGPVRETCRAHLTPVE